MCAYVRAYAEMHNTNRCIPSGVSALPRVDMSLLAWPVMLAPGVRGFEEGLPRVQTDCILFTATGKRDSGTSEVRARHTCATSSIRTQEKDRRIKRGCD